MFLDEMVINHFFLFNYFTVLASETSMAFAKTVAELEKMVIRMLFESYGVEKHVDPHIEATTYLLRFLKYRAPQVGETNMAFPSHTDKSFVTILYQNHISGLEIKARDGEWINVSFPPSSFVVMAGDACKVVIKFSKSLPIFFFFYLLVKFLITVLNHYKQYWF